MKMRKLLILAVSTVGLCAGTRAGGLYLYESGTTDLGLSGAGSAARAGDTSTVYTNPAGMTRLKQGERTFGAQTLYGDFHYRVNNGSGPGNVVGWQQGGLSFDLDDKWMGQSLLDTASLMLIILQPTLAWKLSNTWSSGGGLTLTQGPVKITSNAQPGGGKLVNQSDIDYAYGVRLGVMYEPSPAVRTRQAWSSQQSYDFSIDRNIKKTLTGYTLNIEQAHMHLPQQLMGSAWLELNHRIVLAVHLGWQQWSRFTGNYISSSAGAVKSTLELQDKWHTALGIQQRLTDTVRINGGVAYNSSWNKNDENGSLTWPSSQAWRFSTGVQYDLPATSETGFAMEYLKGSTLKDSSSVSGDEYESPSREFMVVQYIYRF